MVKVSSASCSIVGGSASRDDVEERVSHLKMLLAASSSVYERESLAS